MKCEVCNREAKMFWKNEDHKTGYSEPFYTNKENKLVCIDCLGFIPKTLQELNNERKLKNQKLKEK
jgi:hypothetical protein